MARHLRWITSTREIPMSSIRRSLVHQLTSEYTIMLISLGSMVVLARLLRPDEVGVYSVAASLLVLGEVIRNFGAGAYIVQTPKLSSDKIRVAFTLTLVPSWSLGLIIFVFADSAAAYFEEDGVGAVLRVLSVKFLLIPFGSVVQAYLRRMMRFDAIRSINISGALVTALVTVSLAALGLSYNSLAIGAVAGSIVGILVTTFYRPRNFPLWPGVRGFGDVWGFGWKSTLQTTVGQLSMSVPEILLGKSSGMEAVGLYSRTTGTLGTFNLGFMKAVAPVLGSAFAEMNRGGGALREPYRRVLLVTTAIAWPFFLGMAILAKPIVELLYGEIWLDVIPLIQILCASPILLHMSSHACSLLTMTGGVNISVRVELVVATSQIILAIFLIPYGIAAFLASVGILHVLRFCLVFGPIRDRWGVGPQDYLDVIRRSGTATLGGIVPVAIAVWLGGLDAFSAPVVIGSGVCLAVPGWMWSLRLSGHPLGEEIFKVVTAVRRRVTSP